MIPPSTPNSTRVSPCACPPRRCCLFCWPYRLEVICDGRRIEQRVNGVKCNEGCEADPAAGAILIQTELAEVYVRRWELGPVGKAPPTAARWTDGKP